MYSLSPSSDEELFGDLEPCDLLVSTCCVALGVAGGTGAAILAVCNTRRLATSSLNCSYRSMIDLKLIS